MLNVPETTPASAADFRGAARLLYGALPLYALVPIGFALAFWAGGVPLDPRAFALGAGGWMLALALRAPIGLLVKGLPKERASTWVASASGPLEEGVRLAALLLTATSFRWAASLGQGWAAIEVVFAVVNALVVLRLSQRTDEQAQEIREALAASGNLNASPLVGVVERISASAFHIGSTLLIASNPWWAALMVPIHTASNLGVVRLVKRSTFLAEALMAVVGAATLLAGWLALAAANLG